MNLRLLEIDFVTVAGFKLIYLVIFSHWKKENAQAEACASLTYAGRACLVVIVRNT